MAFSDTWSLLEFHLHAGTVIPNWTADSGMVGEPFTITAVTDAVLMIDAPRAKTAQRVSRQDFEAVYDRWNNYCHGAMRRSEFNPLTRCSKYAISILRWLESHSGGRLP